MNLLKSVKIQTRIILLVIIPLCVTLALSIERLSNAYRQQQKIENLNTVLNYSDVAYSYIATLLEEAFYSRLYIDTAQNPFKDFSKQFKESRLSAKEAEDVYLKFVNKHQVELSKFEVLKDYLQQIGHSIERLQLIRQGADQRSHIYKTGNGELHTMYEFTAMIRKLVLSISETTSIAMQNEQLGKMSNAYYYLLAANMEMSFHNSFVYTAMYNALDVYVYGEIFSGATKVNSYHELFNTFASHQAKIAYVKMTKDAAFAKSTEIGFQARSNIYQKVNKKFITPENYRWAEISTKVFNAYEKTMKLVLNELQSTKQQLISEANTKVYQTLAIMLLLLVIIVAVSILIARSITNPLNEFVQTFGRIAHSKNITVKLSEQGKDELASVGRAFNSLLNSFNQTLRGFQQETQQINQTSVEVADAIRESSELLNNQLTATDNISVAINEMTCTNEDVSNLADNAAQKILHVHDLSVKSSNDAKKNRDMMEQLTVELGNTSSVINSLHDESNQIGNVLNVIQGIAEQTNLLALNAAIEAARAGEQGRGFAVVADEVRSLAGRTQESTEQIREQIQTLQHQANAATTNMIALQQEGQKASEIVLHSTEAFNQITIELEQITELAASIATASQQQTSVSNDINLRITAIRDDSHKITSTIKDITSAADGLRSTGQTLDKHIKEFEL